jgi:hypothetical protein
LLGAVLTAGCGGGSSGDAAAARATVQRYFAAVGAGRSQAACAELSDQSQQLLAEFARPLHAAGDSCSAAMRAVLTTSYGRQLVRLAHARILRLDMHGDSATAAVDGVDRPLQLARHGDAWRIDFSPSVEADRLPGARPGKVAAAGN